MSQFTESNNVLLLERFAYTPIGTFGRLVFPSGFECYTVERPWLMNKASKSCIPEGVYEMEQRFSKVVSETTQGDYSKGWEIKNVPGRTFIMIHPANHIGHLEGCIGVGNGLGFIGGLWAVTDSRQTFAQVMRQLARLDKWMIDIRAYRAEYP